MNYFINQKELYQQNLIGLDSNHGIKSIFSKDIIVHFKFKRRKLNLSK